MQTASRHSAWQLKVGMVTVSLVCNPMVIARVGSPSVERAALYTEYWGVGWGPSPRATDGDP